ncbi:unnamed protein product [Protopolystoma xenopodis]|uniref:Uncharacterized protein n=1 Tax=Protopolystoma xenopodis TaxID=117903 RepID=A0A3S4ZG73_9PLAT|nr:unnamed protein product [Protopolystoma xenopodis]
MSLFTFLARRWLSCLAPDLDPTASNLESSLLNFSLPIEASHCRVLVTLLFRLFTTSSVFSSIFSKPMNLSSVDFRNVEVASALPSGPTYICQTSRSPIPTSLISPKLPSSFGADYISAEVTESTLPDLTYNLGQLKIIKETETAEYQEQKGEKEENIPKKTIPGMSKKEDGYDTQWARAICRMSSASFPFCSSYPCGMTLHFEGKFYWKAFVIWSHRKLKEDCRNPSNLEDWFQYLIRCLLQSSVVSSIDSKNEQTSSYSAPDTIHDEDLHEKPFYPFFHHQPSLIHPRLLVRLMQPIACDLNLLNLLPSIAAPSEATDPNINTHHIHLALQETTCLPLQLTQLALRLGSRRSLHPSFPTCPKRFAASDSATSVSPASPFSLRTPFPASSTLHPPAAVICDSIAASHSKEDKQPFKAKAPLRGRISATLNEFRFAADEHLVCRSPDPVFLFG